jgi:TolA-binding protein
MGFSWPRRIIGIIVTVVVAGMAAHFAGWEEPRWQRLRGMWWLWAIFGLSGGIVSALWLAPLIFAPEPDGSARQIIAELRSQLSSRQTELDQTKQQIIAAQQHIHALQSDLEAQTKELNAEKQARMVAEQRASSSQDKLATSGIHDPAQALSILWMAKSLGDELQKSNVSILITASPSNTDLGNHLTNWFQMGGVLEQWITNNAANKAATVQLPNYKTELDAPKFVASNYSGISIHGDLKYISKDAQVRNMIIDLFGRTHLCADIGWTQKAVPELSQYYGRNIIWIEIGTRAAPC